MFTEAPLSTSSRTGLARLNMVTKKSMFEVAQLSLVLSSKDAESVPQLALLSEEVELQASSPGTQWPHQRFARRTGDGDRSPVSEGD